MRECIADLCLIFRGGQVDLFGFSGGCCCAGILGKTLLDNYVYAVENLSELVAGGLLSEHFNVPPEFIHISVINFFLFAASLGYFHEGDHADVELDLVQHLLGLFPADLESLSVLLLLLNQHLDLRQAPEQVLEGRLELSVVGQGAGQEEVVEVD